MALGFGDTFVDQMVVCRYQNGAWEPAQLRPLASMEVNPAAHALHYGSTCFEGLKAHKSAGSGQLIRIFRLAAHVARMRRSAQMMHLPVPPAELLSSMMTTLVVACRDQVPCTPAALYLRPVLMGTQPNLGAATVPSDDATLLVIASPVGEYFATAHQALRLLIDDKNQRATSTMGSVKTGGNYASALPHMVRAVRDFKVDQVLFAPNGDVQETGAANFLLLREGEVLTRDLDDCILHGVTRDSFLTIARDAGLQVTERRISIDEVLNWVETGEAVLSGTAAGLAPVRELLYQGKTTTTRFGAQGEVGAMLLSKLKALHEGQAADPYDWLTTV